MSSHERVVRLRVLVNKTLRQLVQIPVTGTVISHTGSTEDELVNIQIFLRLFSTYHVGVRQSSSRAFLCHMVTRDNLARVPNSKDLLFAIVIIFLIKTSRLAYRKEKDPVEIAFVSIEFEGKTSSISNSVSRAPESSRGGKPQKKTAFCFPLGWAFSGGNRRKYSFLFHH